MSAELINQQVSMLDSAIGPVLVTTTTYEGMDIDDYVSVTIMAKAEYLRALYKILLINPLYTVGRPVVNLGGTALGGFDV